MIRVAVLAVALCAGPSAQAQEGDVDEGFDLMREGTRMLLRGLIDRMGPAMDEVGEALRNLDAYEPPELLPNGDIIIRRKDPAEEEELPPDGEIEL